MTDDRDRDILTRATINGLGRAWRAFAEGDPTRWADQWAWLRQMPEDEMTDLLLDVILNLARLTLYKLADQAGVDPDVGADEVWSPTVGDDAPQHHMVLGPLLAAVGNKEYETAADVVLAAGDPGNDMLLKAMAEMLAIVTGAGSPPGFFEHSYVVKP